MTTPNYIWFLVERTTHLPLYMRFAERLEKKGLRVRVVNVPEVFGALTKDAIVGNAERLVQSIKNVIGLTTAEFEAEIRKDTPDLLFVCGSTFLRPLTFLGRLGTSPMAIVPILESPDPHTGVVLRGGLSGSVQGWIVPAECTVKPLIDLGAERNRILVGGFPLQDGEIDISYKECQQLRERFGFEGNVLLIRATAIPTHALESLLFQLSFLKDARIIFHHDGNRALADELKALAEKKGLLAQMFGHVDDLYAYIAASTILITTPTDDAAISAVATRTPLILLDIEERYGFVTSHEPHRKHSLIAATGAAEQVSSGHELAALLNKALTQNDYFDTQGTAQARLVPSNTVDMLYAAVEDAIGKASAWKAEDDERRPVHIDDPDENREPSNGSGLAKIDDRPLFEGIGRSLDATEKRRPDTTHRETPTSQQTSSTDDPFMEIRRKFVDDEDALPTQNDDEKLSSSTDFSSPRTSANVDDPLLFPLDSRRNLSPGEAKAYMTELILEQRKLEKELAKAQATQERWYRRLELARSNEGATGLIDTAREELEKARDACSLLHKQIATLEQRKEIVKKSVGREKTSTTSPFFEDPQTSSLEEEFRKLENDARLDDLKRRMKDKDRKKDNDE